MSKPTAALMATALLLVAACAPAPTTPAAVRTAAAAKPAVRAVAPTATVAIADMAFGPQALTVARGTTVTWTNTDGGMPHTVTSDTNAFASARLGDGGTFSFTFNEPGTFAYHCKFHRMMTGTVVVQ